MVVPLEMVMGKFIIVESDNRHELRPALPWILSILGLTGLILTVTCLTLRWIMKPIRWLSDGVSALGEGNLEY